MSMTSLAKYETTLSEKVQLCVGEELNVYLSALHTDEERKITDEEDRCR